MGLGISSSRSRERKYGPCCGPPNERKPEHLNEINKTRDEFFAHMDEVKPLMEKYAKMTFPTLEIKRD